MEYSTERAKVATRIYLERSKTCPLFLTWFSYRKTHTGAREVVDDLIISYAKRWQRIVVMALDREGEASDALFAGIGTLDFPILRDVEITSLSMQAPLSNLTICRNTPLLRQCKLENISFLPPLSSNLVVLDCKFTTWSEKLTNFDSLLASPPPVAHSLENLRFRPPDPEVFATTPGSRILLPNLTYLLIEDSHTFIDHLLTPNLTFFSMFHSRCRCTKGR
jgi:hypothetical protein